MPDLLSNLNPSHVATLAVLIAVTIVVGIVVATVGSSDNTNPSIFGSNSDSSTSLDGWIKMIIIGFMILLLLKYGFGIDVFQIIVATFVAVEEEIEEDLGIIQPIIPTSPPVFNIAENVFTYSEAREACANYGTTLATYSDVENAYRSGKEWNQYGWSEEQMVLFPTQKATYDALQKIPGQEHDQGRPGVNGGYISNPNARFGANCRGSRQCV
jgi:hypothetical protein